ncbi:MAG: NUDIX domain-containing protein [Bacteroidota bacterium]
MYEIYINDRPLRLVAQPPELEQGEADPRHLIAAWRGKTKTLLNYADTLEKGSPKISEITLYYSDLLTMWAEFKSHYKIVEAAGGLVRLAGTDRFLMMERRGYLDLPKGKIDPGETVAEAALREVSEETGLAIASTTIKNQWPGIADRTSAGRSIPGMTKSTADPLKINSLTHDMPPISSRLEDLLKTGLPFRLSLHTYRTKKGKRVLKPTYWFAMESSQKELQPQLEEGIDRVDWLRISEVDLDEMYPSLIPILLGNS